MRTFICILLAVLYNASFGQSITINNANNRLSEIFHRSQKRPQVLLLGTYHFSYPNVDDYKTPDRLRVDVLSSKKQKEIDRVIAVLVNFKPTKIAIEAKASDQTKYDSLYQLYLKGELQEERDERFQIAFRLGKQLRHKKVFCIDAQPFVKTLYEVDSIADQKYSDENDSTVIAIQEMYEAFYRYDDTLQRNMELIDYLTLINSDQYLKYDNGQYLFHTKKGTDLEPVGGDGFISKWFNRNARIYSNIQRTATNKDDKILVLFGGGHIPILKFLLESCQDMELRKFSEFLK